MRRFFAVLTVVAAVVVSPVRVRVQHLQRQKSSARCTSRRRARAPVTAASTMRWPCSTRSSFRRRSPVRQVLKGDPDVWHRGVGHRDEHLGQSVCRACAPRRSFRMVWWPWVARRRSARKASGSANTSAPSRCSTPKATRRTSARARWRTKIAMERIYKKYPEDLEAAAFYALAVDQTALPTERHSRTN